MLGQFNVLFKAAEVALKATGHPYAINTPPTPLCDAGVTVAYRVDVIEKGVKGDQTLYFDPTWQPLATSPAGATPCHTEHTC